MALKVSVVISTYNGENYIVEQLESIRTQTVPVDEVIISDDCSKDNTVSVIHNYIVTHHLTNSWKIYRNEKNKGWIQNFHDLLYIARGDIVFLCDQDDIWFSDKVSNMVSIMAQNSEVNCLSASFVPKFMENKGIKLSSFYRKQMINDGKLKRIPINVKSVHLMSEGCTMCVRKSFLDEVKELWFSGWAHDDFLWKTALCTGGLYRLNKVTLYRRLHTNNVSRQGMRNKQKRINHLTMEYNGFLVMKKMLIESNQSLDNIKMINSLVRMIELRKELIQNKKFINLIPLTFKYIIFYQNKRSYFAEAFEAIKK